MRCLFEGGYYSKYRRRGYYLFQLYPNAATIQGWLLFEVQTSRLLFISALLQCGVYLRAALIRGQRIFEGGAYSRAAYIRGRRLFGGGAYSREALIRGQRIFEGGAYLSVALIQGRRLFKGGAYSREAFI